jgi:aubergine-like protein
LKLEPLPNDRAETFITQMKKVVDPGVQLLMTVFPQLRGDRYSAVKKLCCIDNPIASQCILLKTIKGDDRKVKGQPPKSKNKKLVTSIFK